jgi:hypothetical protein
LADKIGLVQIFFSSPYTFSIPLSKSPSKLGRQPCWVACLLVCVSGCPSFPLLLLRFCWYINILPSFLHILHRSIWERGGGGPCYTNRIVMRNITINTILFIMVGGANILLILLKHLHGMAHTHTHANTH